MEGAASSAPGFACFSPAPLEVRVGKGRQPLCHRPLVFRDVYGSVGVARR
jgi:hypothetical protein